MDVAVVRWPDERDRRQHLACSARPRVLLVAEGHAPPPAVDCLEDWVQMPADEPELKHRIRALVDRARFHRRERPTVDADGLLRLGDRWTTMPPVETRLVAALIDRMGAVVSRDALARAAWPDGAPGRNALDVHLGRIRRRLQPVGLVIRTVRSRGYLLELAPDVSPDLGSDNGQRRVREV